MTSGAESLPLAQLIKDEARRLGFVLAGVTTPEAPLHAATFERWLGQGRHGAMEYLSRARSRLGRADPREVLPECKSILVLAAPYANPGKETGPEEARPERGPRGRVAAYAWGKDYHDVLPKRLRSIVEFVERQLGRAVSSRCYTDTGPVLERDLAQRAGLGWIGKNTCLINPKLGSYLLLAEILLDVELKSDPASYTDHCGKCTRCMDACPTGCILPDRTIDAPRCISYLSIELKGPIPVKLRPLMSDWIFGCDICQMVCPWNRFAPAEGDEAFSRPAASYAPLLTQQLELTPDEFSDQFRGSAVKRARHAGYLRNVAIASGNCAGPETLAPLQLLVERGSSLVREHAAWAVDEITRRSGDRG